MSLQQSKQSEVMEIATFKTKEGVTRKHFLARSMRCRGGRSSSPASSRET